MLRGICGHRFLWPLIKVTFGEHDYCNSTRKPETRFVLRSILGEFSYLNFQNDLALLRLNDRVPMTGTIRPICLPTDTSELRLNLVNSKNKYKRYTVYVRLNYIGMWSIFFILGNY
jgi:hypothetical protein